MKTLFLLRHAKAEKAGPSLPDFKRPLSESGISDAKLVSEALKNKNLLPEKIISSDAVRAYSTACIFAIAFGISKEDVEPISSLYDCTERDYFQVISRLPDSCASCMIAGHNDTITGVAEKLVRKTMDSMKTCGIVIITSEAGTWREFDSSRCQLQHVLYPALLS